MQEKAVKVQDPWSPSLLTCTGSGPAGRAAAGRCSRRAERNGEASPERRLNTDVRAAVMMSSDQCVVCYLLLGLRLLVCCRFHWDAAASITSRRAGREEKHAGATEKGGAHGSVECLPDR